MWFVLIDTVDKLKREFKESKLNHFSDEGYGVILDDTDCYETDQELDVAALDDEYYEYDDESSFLTDRGIPEADLKEDEDPVEATIKAIKHYGGYVWRLNNGHILVREG